MSHVLDWYTKAADLLYHAFIYQCLKYFSPAYINMDIPLPKSKSILFPRINRSIDKKVNTFSPILEWFIRLIDTIQKFTRVHIHHECAISSMINHGRSKWLEFFHGVWPFLGRNKNTKFKNKK